MEHGCVLTDCVASYSRSSRVVARLFHRHTAQLGEGRGALKLVLRRLGSSRRGCTVVSSHDLQRRTDAACGAFASSQQRYTSPVSVVAGPLGRQHRRAARAAERLMPRAVANQRAAIFSVLCVSVVDPCAGQSGHRVRPWFFASGADVISSVVLPA